jgi:hypothetical protein
VQRKRRKNQHIALALASLLTPLAVMAFVLAFWRLAADVNVTSQFPIVEGLFSHWQVWVTGGGVLQVCAMVLNRYGNAERVIQKTVEEPRHVLADSRF